MRRAGLVWVLGVVALACARQADSDAEVVAGPPTTGGAEVPEPGSDATAAAADDGSSGDGSTSTAAPRTTGSPVTTETGEGWGSTTGEEVQPVLLWLFDLESGAVQDEGSAHDGAALGQTCGPLEDAFHVGAGQPVHSGEYSLRVRFDQAWFDDDCGAVSAFFSQGQAAQIEEDVEYWHGWAIYLPDDGGDNWTTTRWATDGQNNKALSIDLRSDLTWRFRATRIGTAEPFELTLSPDTVDFGTGTTEVWHEFVANFVISSDESLGFYRVWHRVRDESEWTQVVDATGRTANRAAPFPFEIRHGMHSGHDWNDSDSASRVLYFDEIRFGGADVGFDGVAPGADTIPAAR
jgi:hypothetical protein